MQNNEMTPSIDERVIKPEPINDKRKLAFYLREYDHLKEVHKKLQEEHKQNLNESFKIYAENKRLKRAIKSMVQTLEILVGVEENA